VQTILIVILLSLPKIGAYAIFAVGIVLMYRASKILNLAHGAMAMVPAYLLYSLVKFGVPVVIAVPVGIAAGAGLGLLVERIFIRRLQGESSTVQTVATVGALGLLVAWTAKIWGTTPLAAVRLFPDTFFEVGNSGVRAGEIGLFLVMLLITGLLMALFRFTDIGLYLRGAAENRRAASLMGVDPDRMTSLAWALGGALAAAAGILLAGVTNLHPYTLALQALPAFVAALLGGLGSIGGAVAGAAIVGLTLGAVPFLPLGGNEGAPQFFLTLLALVVMATRGQRLVATDVRAEL
jgi:branched-chain amino acid transport system permease protein